MFLEEFSECAEGAFIYNAPHMIDNLLYAKLPSQLKRSLNLTYLAIGTYDQTVAHFEKKVELSGLKNDGELSVLTMTAVAPNNNPQKTE